MKFCSSSILPARRRQIKVLSALGAFVAAQSCLALADEKAWQLKQFCTVTGAQEVTFTRDRMKIYNKERQIYVIVDDKENTVLLYHDASKRYYKCPTAKYNGPPAANLIKALGMHEGEFEAVKCGSSKQFGQIVSNYTLIPRKPEAASKQSVPGEPTYFASKVLGYWTFDNVEVNPSLARTLCRSYGLLSMKTIPCSMDYRQFGEVVKGLYTVSLTRVKIKPSEFDGPKGYVKVEKEIDLVGASPGTMIDQLMK